MPPMPPLLPGWDAAVGPYLLQRTGSCTNQITSRTECDDAATRLGLAHVTAIVMSTSGTRYPPFCFMTSGYLYFEASGQNTGSCTSGLHSRCLCLQAPPRPPPAPPASPPAPPLAPGILAASQLYMLQSRGSCDAHVASPEACGSAAATLGFAVVEARFFSSAASPPACFLYGGSLWFNQDSSSSHECSSSMQCICLPGPPTPPSPPRPLPPPPVPPRNPPYFPGLQLTSGAYQLRVSGSCDVSITTQDECEGAAFALGLTTTIVNATTPQPADLLGGQPYCFFDMARAILFFNINATDNGRCHYSHHCLCMAAPPPPPSEPPSTPPSPVPSQTTSAVGTLVDTSSNVTEALTGQTSSLGGTSSGGDSSGVVIGVVVGAVALCLAVGVFLAIRFRGPNRGSAKAKAKAKAFASFDAEAVSTKIAARAAREVRVTFADESTTSESGQTTATFKPGTPLGVALTQEARSGIVRVTDVVEGGVADRHGVSIMSTILSINGQSTAGLNKSGVVELLASFAGENAEAEGQLTFDVENELVLESPPDSPSRRLST